MLSLRVWKCCRLRTAVDCLLLGVQVDINGIPMTLLDTAGMRSTADTVEAMGVERSERAASVAEAVVFVYDSAVCVTLATSCVSSCTVFTDN